MRITLISDTHGNLPALDAVLADVAKQKPDVMYCFGDLVGYGASPTKSPSVSKPEECPRSSETMTRGWDSIGTSAGARLAIPSCAWAGWPGGSREPSGLRSSPSV